MSKYKFSKIAIFLFAAFFMIAPLFLTAEPIFAGQIGTQTGPPVDPCASQNPPERCNQNLQQKFAAAQIRYKRQQPPLSGANDGKSTMLSNFTFLSSIVVLLGGFWTLLALLRSQFGKRRQTNRVRTAKFWDLAFNPSLALSAFGFLFVAAIVGGVLIKPGAATAEKRVQMNKSLMTGTQNPSNKPVFKTTQQIGGSGITQIGAPVFDAAGNRYVRGGFTGTLTIGTTTLTATKDFDLFVAKYDAGGSALWVRKASGANVGVTDTLAVEGATALSVDAGGNVYIGGSFVKTLNLQGGANQNATLSDNGAAGINYESFVAKYDAGGNLLWAKGGNTNSPKNPDNLETGQNGIDQIVFDQSGNPYVAGFVSGNRFLGDAITNNGQSDIMLAKLNPANGSIVWKQIIGGSNDDNGLDLKIDNASNLYLVGNFGSPSITFPNGDTFTNPFDPNDSEGVSTDTFVAKFDRDGSNLWTEDIGNGSDVGISQIAVGAAGDVFITGYFFDSVTFGATTLFETEGTGDDDEASLGGYLARMDANGDFVWAKEFGGIGEALALDGGGRIYVVGTFFDGGTFGAGGANEESLASFGGVDLFAARYDGDGNFDFAKAIAGAGAEGEVEIGNPTSENGGLTENNYNPLGIAYDPARQTIFISGDFQKAIALDCQTLTTSGANHHSYLAELSADNEATSCRIWNGLDDDDNNWDSPDNWNGGVLPSPNDSVYVPYTGNNHDAPDFNPAADKPINNLVIADDRIVTLGRDLTVNNRLDLLGGYIDADNFTVTLGAATQTFSINDGRVLGKVAKQFSAATGAFTFPVGTTNGYSPVTLSNLTGTGTFSVTAHEGTYPNTATNLPPNRAARWWNLTNGGVTKADLTFKYLPGDITQGTESQYRTYRIPTGGGTATLVGSTIDTAAKTVTAPNVSEFSDWTLAQLLAPTAATVAVGGRVLTPTGRGISGVRMTLTDQNGRSRTATTTDFGYYQFENVEVGATYILAASAKRLTFSQAVQVLNVNEANDRINFTAETEKRSRNL